ncbi:MAG: acyl carrier protein [Candidatus Omnitrophica bacterium]|nr:acyl carrier protein [Candidatus Omnitrophota bacterium]
MTDADVLKQVNEIFIDVLDNESIVLKRETVAKDVEEWDSLTHIQLIVTVEKHFKIKFTAAEILKFRDVGHFCDEIIRKLGAS